MLLFRNLILTEYVSLVSRNRMFLTECLQEFPMLQYLLVTLDIAEDLAYDLLKMSENKRLDIFTDHVQMVNKPTHVSRFLINYVYIKKTLIKKFSTNVTVENINF